MRQQSELQALQIAAQLRVVSAERLVHANARVANRDLQRLRVREILGDREPAGWRPRMLHDVSREFRHAVLERVHRVFARTAHQRHGALEEAHHVLVSAHDVQAGILRRFVPSRAGFAALYYVCQRR